MPFLKKISLVLIVALGSCLDPYSVNIDGYDNLLVVDGLITDEDKEHQIILRRSTSDISMPSAYEPNATVKIIEDSGIEHLLSEVNPGIYKTDKNSFQAILGKTYALSIQTSDGKQYTSNPCELLPHSRLDRIHYKKNVKWDINEEYQNEGLSIYVDGSGVMDSYVRWIYEEDWKFNVPYPERWIYDENKELQSITPMNQFCWSKEWSINANVHSFQNQINPKILNKEVQFVPTGLSNKMSIRYSILVKQLTISRAEYEFWSQLKESTENVGGVFASQPYSIKGNVRNVADETEPVLGYFQVGSVVSERIYINKADVTDLDLPMVSPTEGCRLDSFLVDGISYFSPYQIYEEQVLNGSLNFHEPVYADASMDVIGLLLSINMCADCTLKGVIDPPDFWED